MTAEPLQEPTRSEEIRGLLRLLSYAEGFALAFVECNLPVERERLVEELVRALEERGLRARELILEGPEDDLLEQIQALDPPPQAGDVILVRGLERSIPSEETIPHALDRLNLDRELFRDIPCPVVLLLPEYAVTKISREAPDFWAWRSGVFLAGPSKERLEHIGPSLIASTGSRFMSLSGAQKRKRVEVLQELLEAFSHQGSDASTATLHMYSELIVLLRSLGRWSETETTAHRYLELARKLDDLPHVVDALDKLGHLAFHQGREQQALALYQEALDIAERANDLTLLRTMYQTVGGVLLAWGHLEEAEDYFYKALDINRDFESRAGQVSLYNNLAQVELYRGNTPAAEKWLTQAQETAEKLEDRWLLAHTLARKTALLLAQSKVRAAIRTAQESLTLASVIGEKHLEVEALQLLATGRLMSDDPVEAAAALARAIRIESELGVPESHNSSQLVTALIRGLGEKEARQLLSKRLDTEILEDILREHEELRIDSVRP